MQSLLGRDQKVDILGWHTFFENLVFGMKSVLNFFKLLDNSHQYQNNYFLYNFCADIQLSDTRLTKLNYPN